MIAKHRMLGFVRTLFFIIPVLSLTACSGNPFTYEGHVVAEEDRIEIKEGGPHNGFWKTYDINVDYTYEKKTNALFFTGEISFNKHLMYNFRTLEHFYFRIYFVDEEGKILDGKGLVYSGYRVPLGPLSFQKELPLPDDSVAMVFSYTGSADEQGGGIDSEIDGRTDWDFWRSPIRRRR